MGNVTAAVDNVPITWPIPNPTTPPWTDVFIRGDEPINEGLLLNADWIPALIISTPGTVGLKIVSFFGNVPSANRGLDFLDNPKCRMFY